MDSVKNGTDLKPLLIDLWQVQARTGLSRSSISKLRKKGAFPVPLRFGKRCLWNIKRIDEWIEEQTVNAENEAYHAEEGAEECATPLVRI